MYRPTPVPRAGPAMSRSRRTKRSKSLATSRCGMPSPRSRTLIWTCSALAAAPAWAPRPRRGGAGAPAEMSMGLPGAEYLSALASRLIKIWRRRASSARTKVPAGTCSVTVRAANWPDGISGSPISLGSNVSSTARISGSSATPRSSRRGALPSSALVSSTLLSSRSTAFPEDSARSRMRVRCSGWARSLSAARISRLL